MQDVLGELIERTRMHGRVFCQASARAPWGLRFPGAPQALVRLLAAGNAELGGAWTVDTLAHAAGTSRATLGRRLVAEVGEPPLAYLARARMQEASQLLRNSGVVLVAFVACVGFVSVF